MTVSAARSTAEKFNGSCGGYDRLDRLAKWLRDYPDYEDATIIATAIERFLSGECEIDVALDVKARPGERSWQTMRAIRARDALLREAASQFFPDCDPCQQAAKLADAMKRYVGTSWARERSLAACPERYRGRIQAHLWKALKAHPTPLGFERIRKIMVTS